MRTLLETITETKKAGHAVAHFNISDSTQLNAIAEVAYELQQPVIIGVSEGESRFIGIREVAALVREKRQLGIEMYLNADHFKSLEMVIKAVDAGFDSVIIDAAHLPFEENVICTRSVVEYVHKTHPGVLVEAEIGYIGESSKILAALPTGIRMVNVDEVQQFLHETHVDLVAPAVGNVHGVLTSGNPALNIPLIASISSSVSTPLVLHGASGCSPEEIKNAVHAGIAIVHVNTEIRIAYRRGIEVALKADANEVAPYKYLSSGKEDMKNVVREKMQLYIT